MMQNTPDVIVIGSGPTAVSAAFPLVQADLQVLLLEARGPVILPGSEGRPSLSSLRTDAGQTNWSHLLQPSGAALRNVGYASPKLRTAAPVGFGEDFTRALHLECRSFRAVGAFGIGGLSNVWGAAAGQFDRREVGECIDFGELQDSFSRVAARVGISGTDCDRLGTFLGSGSPLQPPLPLSPAAAHLLKLADRLNDPILALGRSRNAVLTRPLDDRKACLLDRTCMWGCPSKAIYNAAYDIESLQRFSNFSLRYGAEVSAIEHGTSGIILRIANGEIITAPIVIVAAGVLASTRLVLMAQKRIGSPIPLLSNPAFSCAFALPSRLGFGLPSTGYGLSQLCFRLQMEHDDYGFGLLYDADCMSAVDIATHMPLSRPGAMAVFKRLLPMLMVGLTYLPGRYSRNDLTLTADGNLIIQGNVTDDFADVMRQARRRLSRHFRRLGAWLVPGSIRRYVQGTEVHYAGTLSAGRDTSEMGEVFGLPGVFVADASVLPQLPAKHHTFTAMANADRIGRGVVQRLHSMKS